MPIPFKKDPREFNQRALFASNVFDLLPEDHPCFVYEDIFQQLVTSSVDEDNQIIVGQHLTQNANDKHEVEPALEEIKETTDDLPDKMTLDNGDMSGDNLESFDGKEIDVYVATGKGEKRDQQPIEDSNRKIKKTDFNYDEDKDCFVCPAGHALELKTEHSDGKKIYQGNKAECDVCPCKARCCNSERGEPRTINTDDKEPLR